MIKIINSKVFKVVFIMLLLFILLNTSVYATNPTTPQSKTGLSDIIGGAKNFISEGQQGNSNEPAMDNTSMKDASKLVYNIFLILGMAVAVIVGIVMGIKFMTGSIDEKADVKNSLIPYVAGCAVVFGAFTIWKFVLNIMQGIPT